MGIVPVPSNKERLLAPFNEGRGVPAVARVPLCETVGRESIGTHMHTSQRGCSKLRLEVDHRHTTLHAKLTFPVLGASARFRNNSRVRATRGTRRDAVANVRSFPRGSGGEPTEDEG